MIELAGALAIVAASRSAHAADATELPDSTGGTAAIDAPVTPYFAPYRGAAQRVAAQWRPGRSLAAALNEVLQQQPPIMLASGPLRFAAATEQAPGEAYETWIAQRARVPTRDNLHDLFNALVWLTFPALKRRLNELQAAQIARDGIGATRGKVRDALTVFDENAALWPAPPLLADALRRRDWPALFVSQRTAWRGAAPPTLFGHALLEKLLQPRKAITAHVWLVAAAAGDPRRRVAAAADVERRLVDTLTPEALAARPPLPLPVLGVPGWWPANETPGFYDDAAVFRPARP